MINDDKKVLSNEKICITIEIINTTIIIIMIIIAV